MNPGELRKWATAELPPEDDVDGNYKLIGCLRHACSQAADAWEAERSFVNEGVTSLHRQLVEANEELFALRKRLEAAMEFAIWLSPCGQAENPPTCELIGEKARELLAALAAVEET